MARDLNRFCFVFVCFFLVTEFFFFFFRFGLDCIGSLKKSRQPNGVASGAIVGPGLFSFFFVFSSFDKKKKTKKKKKKFDEPCGVVTADQLIGQFVRNVLRKKNDPSGVFFCCCWNWVSTEFSFIRLTLFRFFIVIEFYRVLLGFLPALDTVRIYSEFYRVLPSFTELNPILPSFTEFYRVVPCLIKIENGNLSMRWSYTEFGPILPSFT